MIDHTWRTTVVTPLPPGWVNVVEVNGGIDTTPCPALLLQENASGETRTIPAHFACEGDGVLDTRHRSLVALLPAGEWESDRERLTREFAIRREVRRRFLLDQVAPAGSTVADLAEESGGEFLRIMDLVYLEREGLLTKCEDNRGRTVYLPAGLR